MMSEYLIMSGASLAAVAIVALAALKGWHGWLTFKTHELDQHRPEIEGGVSNSMARIEIADLKERLRKLEAIAAGVDL
jgi:hypothetical protein